MWMVMPPPYPPWLERVRGLWALQSPSSRKVGSSPCPGPTGQAIPGGHTHVAQIATRRHIPTPQSSKEGPVWGREQSLQHTAGAPPELLLPFGKSALPSTGVPSRAEPQKHPGQAFPASDRKSGQPRRPAAQSRPGLECASHTHAPAGSHVKAAGQLSSPEVDSFVCNRTHSKSCCIGHSHSAHSWTVGAVPGLEPFSSCWDRGCPHGAAGGMGVGGAGHGEWLPRLHVRGKAGGRRAPPGTCQPGQDQGWPQHMPWARTQWSQPGKGVCQARAVAPLMHPHTPASPAAGLQVPTSIPPSRQPLPSEQHILGSLPRPPRKALAACPTLTTAVPPLEWPSLGVLSSRPPFLALSTSWRYLLHLSACLLPGGEYSGQSGPLAQDGVTPLSVGSPAP